MNKSRIVVKFVNFLSDSINSYNCPDPKYNGEFYNFLKISLKFKIFVDVGANVGLWTRFVLDKTNCFVYSFEPNIVNFNSLKKNVQENSRSILYNKALGSECKSISMIGDGVFSKVAEISSNQTTVVDQTTLDLFVKLNNIEFIDFMKIDVEGFELEVLKGSRTTLSEGRIGAIQFEYGIEQAKNSISFKSLINFITQCSSREVFVYKVSPQKYSYLEPFEYDVVPEKLANYVVSFTKIYQK